MQLRCRSEDPGCRRTSSLDSVCESKHDRSKVANICAQRRKLAVAVLCDLLRMFLTANDAKDSSSALRNQRRKRSPTACFITPPPTSEIERVNGISLGQASTQFCAYPH